MSVKVKEIVAFLDQTAPLALAEKWDNPGLLLGDPEHDVTKLFVALDVTPDVVAEAIEKSAQMIVAHHPVIFTGIKSLVQKSWHNKMLSDIIKHDIAVYCSHTNLDIARGGVNDVLAKKIGLQEVSLLQQQGSEVLAKIVVFVPESHSQQLMHAMTLAGAGHIGKYSDCTFQTTGIGTFRPLEGSNPHIGEKGSLEHVTEVRLETVVTEALKRQVLTAMLKAHPYEEVAYDIYQLQNVFNPWGLGRIGILPEELTARELALQVKATLGLPHVIYADAGNKIRKVAVIGGAGADFVKDALACGADALVTGDIKYHNAQEAKWSGLTMVDAGHQGSEWPVLEMLQDKIANWGKDRKLKVLKAKEQMVLQQL